MASNEKSEPPMTAFRKQNNIKSMFIKSKVPEPQKLHPERKINGMVQCGKACPACPFVKTGKTVKIDKNITWKLNRKFTCQNYNIIYLISCEKERCQENKYIGETGRSLKTRLADHCGYVRNHRTDQATGAHFNQSGHSLANMKVTVLEQVKNHDIAYRKEREHYFINKFNTYHKGMNKQS